MVIIIQIFPQPVWNIEHWVYRLYLFLVLGAWSCQSNWFRLLLFNRKKPLESFYRLTRRQDSYRNHFTRRQEWFYQTIGMVSPEDRNGFTRRQEWFHQTTDTPLVNILSPLKVNLYFKRWVQLELRCRGLYLFEKIKLMPLPAHICAWKIPWRLF